MKFQKTVFAFEKMEGREKERGKNRKSKIFVVVLQCSSVLICCLDRCGYLILLKTAVVCSVIIGLKKNRLDLKKNLDIYGLCYRLCLFITNIL